MRTYLLPKDVTEYLKMGRTELHDEADQLIATRDYLRSAGPAWGVTASMVDDAIESIYELAERC